MDDPDEATRSCSCCVTVATTTRPTRRTSSSLTQVDPDQHSDLLGKLGINPSELMGDIGGKLGL